MGALYRQRHPESTVLYRVLATHFDSFLTRYESLFQHRYGYFRPVIREVVERYLDCANPMCGFARIRCPECAREFLLTFSCKTRHFCPSCHAKRREAWSIWLSRHLLLALPHRQVVFTIPKIIRPSKEASRGWRELIRKVYEVDPLTCPACGAQMKPIAFITNYAVIDKIIHHLGITFTHERPPPPARQEELY